MALQLKRASGGRSRGAWHKWQAGPAACPAGRHFCANRSGRWGTALLEASLLPPPLPAPAWQAPASASLSPAPRPAGPGLGPGLPARPRPLQVLAGHKVRRRRRARLARNPHVLCGAGLLRVLRLDGLHMAALWPEEQGAVVQLRGGRGRTQRSAGGKLGGQGRRGPEASVAGRRCRWMRTPAHAARAAEPRRRHNACSTCSLGGLAAWRRSPSGAAGAR